MTKDDFLAALTAGKHVVIYWNDSRARWAFYDMNNFIDEVLHRQYRKLGRRLAGHAQYLSSTQATEIIEERIRFIHDKLETSRAETGIVLLHVEDEQEIFGYWLVVPCTSEWAREAAEKGGRMPSIHVHRQQPNIRILPDRRVN